ncbi:hypothetical protein SARC_00138 [Sphaeroforma arctica JP610]|uniref:Uncharacterized protein n=1 Tax=Sphaeroforma arctica JP610 TaxID=667725 RepID=A0A0L0GG16_9EUKA|nr:hypothetical protein SARC_00138 [Sphaeroforma arctica JP610]KNC87766.1 hypothetical protein SARC_00138 [Sphaeroforma arctica JP610]|eukprot:XP_014161668.1 hypothetical protein SARC_00138 [Sphaeroforma arctica JP610]
MGATADIKPKTGVVPDFLTEGPKSGDTQDNSPQLKEAADVVTSLKAAKKTKKKGNKILRYAKARWGESKVPVNGLTIDSDLKTEDFQK